MFIPRIVLKQLYTHDSLHNVRGGFEFTIKNRLAAAVLEGIEHLKVGDKIVDTGAIKIDPGKGELINAKDISKEEPLDFPVGNSINVYCEAGNLPEGTYNIELAVQVSPYGKLNIQVQDSILNESEQRTKIPFSKEDNYSGQIIGKRQQFVEEFSGASLHHTRHYSIDPASTRGNIENFTGVAQVPVGFAGPLKVDGEYARGEYLVPLATTEGTLVASYNRGMKAINASGGVMATVTKDQMQRAPVFVFEDARQCKAFLRWIEQNMDSIRSQAEQTSSVIKLQNVETYLSNKFVFLRFNFTTGDAAGQNMVGKATYAACNWILQNFSGVKKFYLESNFATDKKTSQVNTMTTRGKRVTAEVTLKRDVLIEQLRVEPESIQYHHDVSSIGAFISGANNNGAHSANAISALFIATGQDVANVAESSAGVMHTELQENGDLYMSLTIPSLIVATHGGGTNLPTQRECLKVMGCHGKGNVLKFAEVVAGVALAGEISLAAAISSLDWVASHEEYGRNR